MSMIVVPVMLFIILHQSDSDPKTPIPMRVRTPARRRLHSDRLALAFSEEPITYDPAIAKVPFPVAFCSASPRLLPLAPTRNTHTHYLSLSFFLSSCWAALGSMCDPQGSGWHWGPNDKATTVWQAPCYSWRAPTPYTKQHTARPHHRAPRQPCYRRGLAASRNTVDPPLHQHNLESTARGRNIAGYLSPPLAGVLWPAE